MSKEKPTECQWHLKLIVEWMDETFKKNDDSSVLFLFKLRSDNESFDNFFMKKYHAYLIEQGIRQPAKIYQFKKQQ